MTAQVRRDLYGIPHLVAPSVTDLARLQGREVGRDRTWQLTYAQLKAEGRTASVLGTAGLPWDRFARRARLDALGRRAYDALGDETRRFVDAYVEGANDGLAQATGVAELEHLGIEPGRFEPWTPLSVFAAQHVLFGTFPNKLWRRHVADLLGPEAVRLLGSEGPSLSGSNAWAVGGDRTATGLPLVAGDPHRSFESPDGYQQVRLTCTAPEDSFDVAGFTFPGVPGVQHFAHAGDVAWGITNAMGDYQDVFVERLARHEGAVRALGPDGWHPVASHVEEIEVRDREPERVEVIVTDNGPVVHGGPEAEEALSLRTTAYVLGSVGFDCLLPLLRARSTAEVVAAFDGWVEPVNNLVVADVHGDVRHQVVGRMPDRDDTNRWQPVPGWDARHEWRGWLDLPGSAVSADGHVVTANNRMTDFEQVGVEFAPPGRADRIDALLSGRDDLTAADMAAIHNDVLAGQPAALAAAIAGLDGLSPQAAALQAEIAGWDQHFRSDSTTAAAYVGIRDAVVGRLVDAEPFSRLTPEHSFGPVFDYWFLVPLRVWLALATLLSPEGRQHVPDLDDHLAAAVEEMAAGPRTRWADRHRFSPIHALGWPLDDAPGLPGDNDCVRCAGVLPGSAAVFRGSVARYVWDLAGLDGSGWVVPLGASGDPASPHSRDQLSLWVAGRLAPVSDPGRTCLSGREANPR